MYYLAPLNYDRFFKRVFSHDHIAKRFLEDFLQVKIEEFQRLPEENRVTDDAAKVIFDYRCKINGQYVTIDMQQWYKTDVVRRFYLYHAVNTVLQMETMQNKTVFMKSGLNITVKDYQDLAPVLTVIWMVDDILHFKNENYVTYKLLPEAVEVFLADNILWNLKTVTKQTLKPLLEKRKQILKIMQNKHKDLEFMGKNKIYFLFQHNIVKSQEIKPYRRWFDFAERTRNENNTEADFESYTSDPVFADIIRIINRQKLTEEDFSYIKSEAKHAEQIQRFIDGEQKKGRVEGRLEGIEEGKIEGKIEVAQVLKKQGISFEIIALSTGLSIAEIEQL
ncbi:MAG: hypothetical protein RL329_1540 [Bacteroidota bacterium]